MIANLEGRGMNTPHSGDIRVLSRILQFQVLRRGRNCQV